MADIPKEVYFIPSQAQSNIHNMTFLRRFNDRQKDQLFVAYHRPNSSDIVCINVLGDASSGRRLICVGFVQQVECKGYVNIYEFDQCNDDAANDNSSTSSHQDTVRVHVDNCLFYTELTHAPLQVTHSYYISPLDSKLHWAYILSRGNPYCLQEKSSVHKSSPCIHVFTDLNFTVDEPESPSTNAASSESNKAEKSTDTSPPLNESTSSGSYSGSNPNQSDSTPVSGVGQLDPSLIAHLFPELQLLLDDFVIIHMNFAIYPDKPTLRFSAFGIQTGEVILTLTDMLQHAVLKQVNFSHGSPITHVRIFDTSRKPWLIDELDQDVKLSSESTQSNITDDKRTDCDGINLLVCSSFEPAVVYCNALATNDRDQYELPASGDHDVVTSAGLFDVAADDGADGSSIGIVIGTFGQQLLFYRWTCSLVGGKADCVLLGKIGLIGVPHAISPLPINLFGDGLLRTGVLSSRGLHLFQQQYSTSSSSSCTSLQLLRDRLQQVLMAAPTTDSS